MAADDEKQAVNQNLRYCLRFIYVVVVLGLCVFAALHGHPDLALGIAILAL